MLATAQCLVHTTDVPRLTTGLCPNKPIVSWKYPKWKMSLLHLTYWTWRLSLALLRRAPDTAISLRLGKIILNKSLFVTKCWNISCNWLNTVLKVNTGMAVWGGKGCQWISPWLWRSRVTGRSAAAPHHRRRSSHTLLAWEEIQTLGSKYAVY